MNRKSFISLLGGGIVLAAGAGVAAVAIGSRMPARDRKSVV